MLISTDHSPPSNNTSDNQTSHPNSVHTRAIYSRVVAVEKVDSKSGIKMKGFSNTFVTEEVMNDDDEDFDPFNIGNATSNSPKLATNNGKIVSTGSAAVDGSKSILSAKSSASSALPPRIMIKFKIQEEVSSIAHLSDENEGSSDVQIEGTVLAQVVSSDALKNIPFFLLSSTDSQKAVEFMPNHTYAKKFLDANAIKSRADINIVNIPKETFGFVNIGNYRISQSMEHMPLLLEQKVVRSKSKIQIAIQVRSKLSNPDNLSDFSIVVFIPKQVDGRSIEIVTGDGDFDLWKRCITWEKQNLPKGQSFMVGAKCVMDSTSETLGGAANEELKFPVMLRCQSKDQISSVQFHAIEANGHPASVTSSVVGKSYRIVHRLK